MLKLYSESDELMGTMATAWLKVSKPGWGKGIHLEIWGRR
jgi:hypothetical protein